MSLIHRKVAGLLVVSLAVGALFYAVSTPGQQAQAADRYSGRDLFRGIVFVSGPVADVLYGATPAVDARTKRAQAKIIAEIAALDPGFYRSFARRIQSGDHIAIEAALRDSFDLLRQSARNVFGVTARQVNAAADSRRGPHILHDFQGGQDIYIATFLAYNLYVYSDTAFISQTEYFFNPRGSLPEAEIQQDKLVNDVAVKLAI